jgi:hypothetical protein
MVREEGKTGVSKANNGVTVGRASVNVHQATRDGLQLALLPTSGDFPDLMGFRFHDGENGDATGWKPFETCEPRGHHFDRLDRPRALRRSV